MSFSKVRNLFSRTYPLLGNMATCGTLYGLGDISQQTLFKEKGEAYNFAGTGRIVGMSTFGFGPIYYFWYKLLDRRLPGTAMRAVVPKLILDQMLCTPFCLVLFFVGLSYLEGKEDKFEEFRQKGLKAFLTGCAFWPVAQTVNFALCPPHLRTAYVSSCAFVWSNVLCFIKSSDSKAEPSITDPIELATPAEVPL